MAERESGGRTAEAERCPIKQWHEDGEECPGHGPVPGSTLPCGCYLSRVDYNAVLCDRHEAQVEGTPESADGGSDG